MTRSILTILTNGLTFSLAMSMAGTGSSLAQTYPSKPVRILTAEAGGAFDIAARTFTRPVSEGLGQRVIIDNRPSILIPNLIKSAPADGYTVCYLGTSFLMAPILGEATYNPSTEFSPVTLLNLSHQVLAVNRSLPVASVKELIAMAKAQPGALNYAKGRDGSGGHLASELFISMAAINMVAIPFKGGGPAIASVLAGQTQVIFANSPEVAEYFKSGRLKLLGVSTPKATPLAPGLKPISDDLPGFEASSGAMMFAPPQTPVPVIQRLNQEMVRYAKSTEGREGMLKLGLDPVGSTSEELSVYVKYQTTKWTKVIEDGKVGGAR